MTSKTFSAPRPPRNRPAPPESSRVRNARIRSGDVISIASIGMFMQLTGPKSRTSIPSLVARAPTPPAPISLVTNGRPVRASWPPNAIVRWPESAPINRAGMAWANAPITAWATRTTVTVRAFTGAGCRGLTMDPSGSTNRTMR